ncbi:hypothetical protein F4804DRAFT_141000 [Jackrogersella minutella]|nr:hypothetical protein F4804DRAFT_141000 [Jackrogersella minutella]
MRLASVAITAILPAAFAAQQRVLAHSTSMKIEDAPSSIGKASLPIGCSQFPFAPDKKNDAADFEIAITIASITVLANATDSLARPPKPLTTVAAEKPALEASVMGLIVFSAAGLYLL